MSLVDAPKVIKLRPVCGRTRPLVDPPEWLKAAALEYPAPKMNVATLSAFLPLPTRKTTLQTRPELLDLPQELLAEIVRHVDFDSLPSLRLSCHTLYSICLQTRWKAVSIRESFTEFLRAVQALTDRIKQGRGFPLALTYTESLEIILAPCLVPNFPDSFKIVLGEAPVSLVVQFMLHCPKLRHLHVYFGRCFAWECLRHFGKAFPRVYEHGTMLESLRLTGLWERLGIVSYPISIRRLRIRHPETTSPLANLQQNRQLETLHLDCMDNRPIAETVVAIQKAAPQLQVLSLFDSKDGDWAQIFSPGDETMGPFSEFTLGELSRFDNLSTLFVSFLIDCWAGERPIDETINSADRLGSMTELDQKFYEASLSYLDRLHFSKADRIPD